MKPNHIQDQVNAERLSSLLDGELEADELGALLAALDQNPQLKQLWVRMNLARAALAKPAVSVPSSGVRDAVMDALDQQKTNAAVGQNLDESLALTPARKLSDVVQSPSTPKPIAKTTADKSGLFAIGMGWGVAASLAFFIFFVFAFDLRLTNPGGSSDQLIVQQAPDLDQNQLNLIDSDPVDQLAVPVLTARAANSQALAAWQVFKPYLMAHTVQSANIGSNVVAFGRVVDPAGLPKPVTVIKVRGE